MLSNCRSLLKAKPLQTSFPHVGKILERDNVGDVLRARLACKHWHTCFTRCVARLTLYGAPVPLPAAANDYASASQPFPPPKPLATAQDWPHLELQAQAQLQQTQQLLQPDLSATPQEPLPHARMPPGLPRQHPSSPHPSARYGRHIQLIPSLAPTIKHVTVCGRACDLAGLRALAASLPSLTSLYLAASSYPAALPPQLQTQLQLTPQAAAPHEELNPVTTAAVAAAVDAKAAAAEAAPAGLDLLLVPRGGGGGGGGDGYWPPAPPRLEKLWVALHEDVPPYTLHQLLLLQGPSAVAVAPLRELGFLPPKAVGVDVSGVGASWVRPAFVRRMPYMDLSPLLDPRLAGVTRLVLPAMSNRREEQTPLPPAAAADARHRLPEQRQQQQQQEPPVQRQQQQRVQAPGHGQAGRTDGAYDSGSGPSPGPGALGFEDIVSRMTQLRSLTVLSQLLTSLELNFLSEWWMDAGDLCVLSRLAQLRRLKFSLDYGLECADVMSEDEQYEHGMYDTGPNLDKLPTDLETGAAMEMEMIETDAGMEGQVLEQGRDVANVAVVAVYDRQQGRRQRHELAGNVAGEVSGGQRRRKYDTVDELARAMAAVLGRGVVQRGRGARVSYGHILCLGLMTELRSLTLSFEVTPPPACTARPSPASGCSVAAEGRYDKADRTNQYDNPLLVLSRLRLLTELRIHIKQPQGSAYGIYEPSASDSGGAAFLVAAPMDDDVLGEGALAAVGRHGALRSLELRLKVFPPPTSSSNSPKPKWVTGAAGGGGGGGGAASSSMPGIGYGSYYALRAALARPGAAAAAATAAASGAVGIISLFDSSAVTPLGVSPQGPGSYAAGCGAQGYLPPLVQVDSGSSGAAAANDVAAAAAESVCRSVDWRERLLAAGVQGSEELLADVPYFVRPHHLPPTLTALDLTNAAFSAEWALCTQLAVPPPPAAATATAAAAPPPPPGTLLEPPRGSRREGALDPTRITDWHLVHLTACHPTLERLELYDIGDDGCGFGAAEAPDVKLHHRAVAQLGRLRYLYGLLVGSPSCVGGYTGGRRGGKP
ncbi:hypothetical protein VOLCADRAFT_95172 [Volvox carteri f. nagariensis]|uniref:Uncharacterized protein n=1 Tax=Volvox carteri f. nagariensis TaxID=3068 RepID=D8U6T1_VOLCA|nr:uncharacterized protein VOLCADRAFT_95172 [Volvox carteri f. nagariensis]EFJ44493.1 hypothetical protein VOLCADRAFT_95172 [Volvox carteri f. nagariensis]|eukprot:XP_002954343.1 hypothetical protein VOLCADRAFT_95172 [Volvox carteri f. nagariensis]